MSLVPTAAINHLYKTALNTIVVCTFVSYYEIFRKVLLIPQGYTNQVGQDYKHPSHRYFAEKDFKDMFCTIIWGIGHLALRYLGNYRKEKGEALYQSALSDDANRITLLQEAAHQYRHLEAIFKLGISLRDGDGVTKNLDGAIRLFKAGDELGHKGCSFALGQLCLTGDYGDKATCFENADTYFRKVDSTPYTQYLLALAEALEPCKQEADAICTLIKGASNKFLDDFSPSGKELANFLGVAIENSQLGSLLPQAAIPLFNCVVKHCPQDSQKAEAYFHLYKLDKNQEHLIKAAKLGSVEVTLELADLISKQPSKENLQEALRWLNSIPEEKRTSDVIARQVVLTTDLAELLRQSGSPADHQEALRLLQIIPEAKRTPDINMLMGLFYLTGFGSDACDPTKAAEYFGKANQTSTVHTTYFVALSELLKTCTDQELETFRARVGEINQTLRWRKTIPLMNNVDDEDIALAVALRSYETVIDRETGSLLPAEATSEAKVALTLKLLDFCSKNSLPPLAKKTALSHQAILHHARGNSAAEMECHISYKRIDPEDPKTRMMLYSLYMEHYKKTKVQSDLDNALRELDVAVKKEHAPAQYENALRLINGDKKNQSQNSSFFSKGSNKENTLVTPGQKLMLKAAKQGYKPALSFAQQRGWATGISTETLQSSRVSISSQAGASTVGSLPPPY